MEIWKQLLGLVVLDRRSHNHIVAYTQRLVTLAYPSSERQRRNDLPGTQLIGVVTLCLSPVCSESTTLNTSAVLRPVEAG